MLTAKKVGSFLVLIFFTLIAHGPLAAQSGIFDRVGIIPGHGSYSSLPEESVDLFTGNATLRFRDVYLPGPNGLDLEVWRVYNSKILKDRQSGQSASVQAYHQSWVGIGWTMHMGMVHQETSSTPVIEFPDGRLETAFPDNYGTNRNITKDFLKYDKVWHKLYFKSGIIWTFGATATITRADGTSDPVRLVTKIENPYGHHIDIVYDSGKPTIKTITDSMGRVVTFVTSGTPKKLTQIKTKDAGGLDRIFAYSVGTFSNGYFRLNSFTPPMLPATTFQYYDGTNDRYELTRMTTSYGGVLEFSYVNHDFYFSTIYLDSRVVSQKKITFNPGDQATWNFTYPTYQGVTSGTATVQGPLYSSSVVNLAFDSQNPWKIGLMASRTVSDGSASESFAWTYQQISNTNWTVLGVNMGTAKGPLASAVTSALVGDSTVSSEYLYERTNPKRYGLPTKVNTYINGAGSPKGYVETTYYFEGHSGFMDRYMVAFPFEEKDRSGAGALLRWTMMTYFEETGKWGAVKLVKKWKEGTTFYTWDYGYECTAPDLVKITVDPPGGAAATILSYRWGVKSKEELPDYVNLTRGISQYDSSVSNTKSQFDAVEVLQYDNAGRLTGVDRPSPWNDTAYSWRENGENKVDITQGLNKITKYWDGMGRDTGFTELGDGTTLYSRKTLDAEGRVVTETKASVSPSHTYAYAYDAAGRLTQITDPLNKATTIGYLNHKKTVTDAESHSTEYEYNDLPGLPTSVKDAKNYIANYTYDAMGRLTNVNYQSGARTHTYVYDGVDNVTSEIHPETGSITYLYDASNRLAQKTWATSWIGFWYDTSSRLSQTQSAQGGIMDIVEHAYNSYHGALLSVTDRTYGWSRYDITYSPFGKVYNERVVIPGLGEKLCGYNYDADNNPISCNGMRWTNNGFGLPRTVGFTQEGNIVSNVSYGAGKQPTSITFANGTGYSAAYNNAGMLASASLVKGGTTLYDASYTYDGVGNIHTITSTAPSNPPLNATFWYDELNRLISATYTAGTVGTYAYEYDAFGNMTRVLHDGGEAFNKTYDSANRIQGFGYDARGNLTSAGDRLYYWDSQNRLQYIQNTSGEVLGKYLYDDRGLRLVAVPPLPEINVKHDLVDIPTDGDVFLSVAPGQSINETLTIENHGDANLTLNNLTISEDPEGNFSVVQQPSTPVTPSSSTTFIIQFHPQTAGHKSAVLTIPNNDVNENPYLINLYGNWEPEISIPSSPDGGTVDFGEVEIGNFWQETFTVSNLGSRNLVLSGSPIVLVTGPDAMEFTVEQQPISPVLPQGSTSFIIRFSPTSEGPKTASVSIINNDWDENPYDITFVGTGELPPPKIADDSAFEVTSPEAGEELRPGSVHVITWKGASKVQNVKIEYSTDNGSTFRTVVEKTPNSGSFPWLVPQAASPACLVRVLSADGSAVSPLTFSYEFKFRVPSSGSEGSEPPTLSIRASAPDARTQCAWTADVSFAADKGRGFETMTLNAGLADLPAIDNFLGAWHQARIAIELETYTASAWVDGKVVFDKVPLRQSLEGKLIPEVAMTCRSAAPASIWVDDLEVKLRDRTLRPQVEGEEVSQALARDMFEIYKTGVFPRTGGWLTAVGVPAETSPGSRSIGALPAGNNPARSVPVRGIRKEGAEESASQLSYVAEDEAGQSDGSTSGAPAMAGKLGAALVDGQEFVSGARSFRLETLDFGSVSVVKRFALPARVPFGVSGGNFAIGVKLTDAEKRAARGELSGRSSRGSKRDGKDGKQGDRTEDRSPGGSGGRASASSANSSTSSTTRSAPRAGTSVKSFVQMPRAGNYYLYSFDGRLLARYDVYGFCQSEYIYMGNRLIAERDHVGNRYLYYTSDQINSTRVVTDDTGTVVYARAYDPYGGIQLTWVNSFDPTPKFSAKERDVESGLDYFGARYYDSSQYRFISVDPITSIRAAVDSQKLNLYSYCRGNPIIYIDPNGAEIILFNRKANQFWIVTNDNYLIGPYNASNRANIPWPNGVFRCVGFVPSPNNQPGDAISGSGSWEFDVPHRTLMRIHAGRWEDEDASIPPQSGYLHYTNGCIRTDEMGMGAINYLAFEDNDPPSYLIVGEDELDLIRRLFNYYTRSREAVYAVGVAASAIRMAI